MQKFSNALRNSYYLFSTLNGWDSAIVLGVLSYGATQATFDIVWLSLITALVTTAIMVYTIDVVSTIGLLPTIEAYSRKDNATTKTNFAWVIGYLILLSALSFSISWFGRDYITEIVIPTPQPEDVTKAIVTLDAANTTTIKNYEADIKRAEAERQKAERNAGSPALRELAAQGNAWAKGVLEKNKEAAAASHTAEIAMLASQKAAASIQNDSLKRVTAADIKKRNDAADASANKKRHLISGFMMAISIASLVMMWICAVTIAGLGGANRQSGASTTTQQQQQSPPPPHTQQTAHQKTSNLRYAPYYPTFTVKANPNYTVDNYVNPVITTQGAVITGTVGEAEVDRDENTNAIVQVKIHGKALDKTKMKEYLNVYKRRAENEESEYDVRMRNYKTATTLNESLWTLYGEQRIHIVVPEKPKTWVQQDLFNQTT